MAHRASTGGLAMLAIVSLASCGSKQSAGGGGAAKPPADPCANPVVACMALRPHGGDAWGCQEGDAAQKTSLQATCTPQKDGQYVEGSCPRDHAIAACRIVHGTQCVTTWFYKGGPTRAEIDSDCARQGGKVITK